MSLLRRMLEHLTDNYQKQPQSRIGKLFTLVAEELDQVKDTLQEIERARDMDQASGETLDRIGYNVQQYRGQANDEIFRLLIKSKIARNLSTGDINTLIHIISITLDADPAEIEIVELHSHPTAPEPAAIALLSIPLQRISQAGMSIEQFSMMVQRMVAAGIRVNSISLAGTFQFASGTESEYDAESGFANPEQTTGGKLGAVYAPGYSPQLPL
jgi:hypothetical protein